MNIEAQPIRGALEAFGKQTGIQVLFRSENVSIDGLTTPRVTGELSAQEALDRLLANTGLKYEFVNEHTVRISSGRPLSGVKGTDELISPTTISNPGPAEETKSGGKVFSKGENTKLEEIVVTAQKREQRLQDVPVPVTAISADSLVASNQLRLQDYYTRVPGLMVSPSPSGGDQTVLGIRGITSGTGGNPSVGITIDDVPYGSSTNEGGGNTIPDIDPSDLARIEVLRGPQGTLYGASSLGGLLKFVTVDPSTDALSGRVQAGFDSVYNGAELGYSVRGAVNVPLSDTVAIRLSGFTRQDPGYIDNPVLRANGVNEAETYGGHLAALWRPSDDFSLKFSALLQDVHGYGSNDADVPTPGFPQTAGLTDLQQIYIRDTGQYDRKVQAYSVTMKGMLGTFDVISLSGYNINTSYDVLDGSYSLGGFAQSVFGVAGAPVISSSKDDKFTQELRLSTPIGQSLDWLLGAYYTYEDTPASENYQNIMAENPTTGAYVGQIENLPYPTTYQEYAAFTDLTIHVVDRFDVQIGGRESQIKQTLQEGTAPKEYSSGNAFTYLLTPEFKWTPDFMVYARVASGYRAGGPNLTAGVTGIPSEYAPDRTQNYEIGAKAEFLDHRLSLDASAYYIDWTRIQVQLLNPANERNYYANGGSAKSQGIELSLESRPLTGLRIAAWVALDDAVLTENFPANSTAYGLSGDKLPLSSRLSGNVTVDEEFPIMNGVTGFVGGALSYIGNRLGDFESTPERQYLPAYAKTDLRAGAKYDAWTANLYVNNLADKQGVLGGGIGTYPPFAFTYIQPRTVGLSLSRTF